MSDRLQGGIIMLGALILAALAAVAFFFQPAPGDPPADGPLKMTVSEADLPLQGQIKVLGDLPVALGHHRDGGIYALSLRCPYLGCRLVWNEGTHQFHCPCHGDRFTADGSVLVGRSPTHLNRFALRRASSGGVEVLFSRGFAMVGTNQPPDVQYPLSLFGLHM
jgi:Rieske Fe-S protein